MELLLEKKETPITNDSLIEMGFIKVVDKEKQGQVYYLSNEVTIKIERGGYLIIQLNDSHRLYGKNTTDFWSVEKLKRFLKSHNIRRITKYKEKSIKLSIGQKIIKKLVELFF